MLSKANYISLESIRPLIEPHFWPTLEAKNFVVEPCAPSSLLTYNRLDLAIKYLHLEFLGREALFAEKLYKSHIRCFTLGKFQEPGNADKSSFRAYLEQFETLFLGIEKDGFDVGRSVVPIGQNGTILNGAHRVAASLFSNKQLSTVRLPVPDSMYDYRFFLERGMSVNEVEKAVCKFLVLQENCYIACIWPRAAGKDKERDSLFEKVVYKKSIDLSWHGAHNLLAEVYAGESWLGSCESNFPGVKAKLSECFVGEGRLRIVAFQSGSLDEVVELKEKIRQLYDRGKHSVHITDTRAEAIRLSRVLFNSNSLSFLERGAPRAFGKTLNQLDAFRGFLGKNEVDAEDVVLDSGTALALYGLRDANDIDYLSERPLPVAVKGIDSHDSELRFHKAKKSDLIYDSRFFFYFQGLKILSLEQVASMKENRGYDKDQRDLQLMVPALGPRRFGSVLSIQQRYFFLRAKAQRLFIVMLRKVRVYSFVRKVYRLVRV